MITRILACSSDQALDNDYAEVPNVGYCTLKDITGLGNDLKNMGFYENVYFHDAMITRTR